MVVVRAYRVSDDDGGRAARVSAAHVATWVAAADRVFAPAGFQLRFDAHQDLPDLRSTIVNNAMPEKREEEVTRALAPLLARHPGEIVVLLRHGPGPRPSPIGFSGLFLDYVVMPGFEGTHPCGRAVPDAFAHELGHFVGLPHTFARTFATQAGAEAYFRARGLDRAIFDGDGLEDTAPDPAITSLLCADQPTIELAGERFELPRRNLMSYYADRDQLSASQLERARWVMRERIGQQMALARNAPDHPLELERLAVTTPRSCRVQSMRSFAVGRWSGDAQQLCTGTASFRMPVGAAGRYRLTLYATRAPDFAQVQVKLDGQPLGLPQQWFAPVVLPSGAIELGERSLDRGHHPLAFEVIGRAPRSTDDKYGIDAIELTEVSADD